MKQIKNILYAAICLILIIAAWILIQRKESEGIWTLENTHVYLPGEEISAICVRDDGLWVGTKDGVKVINPNDGTVIRTVVDDIELVYAADMYITDDGGIFIGHNDGLTYLDKEENRTDYVEPLIAGGRVNTIEGINGKICIGSMDGLSIIAQNEDEYYVEQIQNKEHGLLSDTVNDICLSDPNIWFGSYMDNKPGGVSILSADGTWQYLTVEDGLPHPYINAFCPIGNRMLIATGQLEAGGLALAEYIDDAWSIVDIYDIEDNIPGEKVRYLYADAEGYLWITTESDGLLVTQFKNILEHPIDGLVIKAENGLSDNEIKSIKEDDLNYYLAGKYGLTVINKNTVKKLLENR